MISVSDFLKLLEKAPVWARISKLPDELDALRRRIELLEQSIARTPKADECPKCHGLAYGLDRSEPDPTFGDAGIQRHYYRCKSCGYETFKQDG